MTKTQFYTATSIDGFIADERNSLDWLFQFEQSEAQLDRYKAFLVQLGAMAMGATTYEWILAHENLLDDPGRWQNDYGDRPCWVFTHRELPVIPGARITFVRDDVEPVHASMVAAAKGRNVWLIGGGDLVGQFADKGLLDEIVLGIAPVTLGAGAPLLPRRLTSGLRLTGVDRDEAFAYLTYEVNVGAQQ